MSTEGWVKLGTAEITPHFEAIDKTTAQAIELIDLKIKKYEADHYATIQLMKDYRNSLLSLPNPNPNPG